MTSLLDIFTRGINDKWTSKSYLTVSDRLAYNNIFSHSIVNGTSSKLLVSHHAEMWNGISFLAVVTQMALSFKPEYISATGVSAVSATVAWSRIIGSTVILQKDSTIESIQQLL